ncbi:ThiJ/PfpI family protein [Labilithrix luteola]|uniref:ThiJ/PfpI family protein n=1 Tax=Labilithrix luteola TaxID=1391654 RepID=A0A0K1PQM3_9BACT|nr:DJ-1/PfpI family protein [Labilithrix luteola]AKU95822.1 ThiJ/PfpI family protein [Labilithrix luteola]
MDSTPRSLEIGMLVHPGMTALDAVAPQLVFANMLNTRVHLVWKTLEPVVTDTGLALLPTATFETCPYALDVLFVGGAKAATWPLLADVETVEFVRSRGSAARWVTSVCTGSLLLGAAGLLQGYRATSHWAVRDCLGDFGATPVDARVVIDGNRMTGGGVTAGMDFGLQLAALLHGEPFAKVLQLLVEYHPEPPFETGLPSSSDRATLELATSIYGDEIAAAKKATKAAGGRLME